MNVCLAIEYDGSHFHGWQIQPGLKTIEGELNRVLTTLCREPIRCIASGRTDSGVHAKAQIVNFRVQGPLDLGRIAHGVSSIMRRELSVVNAAIVPDDFDARRSAKRKQYRYTIHVRPTPPILGRGKVWHARGELNVSLMQIAAKQLVGTHDFSSFRDAACTASTTVRTIESSEIELDYPSLHYRVVGNGFLKQMVRNIVGTLVLVGRGQLDDIQKVLLAKDRRVAGPTAPAHGLTLEWVDYQLPGFCPNLLFPGEIFWGPQVA